MAGSRRALVVAALLLAGCGASDPPATAPTTSKPTTTTLPAADPRSPATIITPGEDAPNPFALRVGPTTYLYASQKEFYGDNIQVRSGPDLHHLGPVHDAMPDLPPWVWAGSRGRPTSAASATGTSCGSPPA